MVVILHEQYVKARDRIVKSQAYPSTNVIPIHRPHQMLYNSDSHKQIPFLRVLNLVQ